MHTLDWGFVWERIIAYVGTYLVMQSCFRKQMPHQLCGRGALKMGI